MGTARTGLKSRVTALPSSSQAGFPHESSHCWERLCGHPSEIPLPRESLLVSLAQSLLPPSTVGSVLVSKLALGIQQCCSWTEHWGLHPACSTPSATARARLGTQGQTWDSWPKGCATPDDVVLQNKSSGEGGGREDVVFVVFAFPSDSYSR